ncbi:uncharacterized protein LOC124814737 [Hydra vulgaris]|uniref:uncharacterized protein LOC124814737 n=1 Tax=Hydra vulgaris TaxID=6087 RepID=UPI001F5FC634|nr:uncharacterized protein LOC124814737 [Hydra vulgaris]
MYELYLTYCEEKNIAPVKKHLYRFIFDHHFNIEFQKPKTDLCDTCYEYRNLVNPTEEQAQKFTKHIISKNETKAERDKDRKIIDKNVAVVCIYLENVISLPKSNVGAIFYKRKLSAYNLTGHCSINKKGYCMLWHEGVSGRAGNDLASSVTCLLEKIIADHSDVNKLILWLDSCVPQNRNSYMSIALRQFLICYPKIRVIEQKFCEPGHSSIQEVDNIHSQIDRALALLEIFSPLGLTRAISAVQRRNSFFVYQMKRLDFKHFPAIASYFNFKLVPYSQIKHLVYRAEFSDHVYYRKSFSDVCSEARIRRLPNNPRSLSSVITRPLAVVPMASTLNQCAQISSDKTKDLKSMFKYMSAVDVAFYKSILK